MAPSSLMALLPRLFLCLPGQLDVGSISLSQELKITDGSPCVVCTRSEYTDTQTGRTDTDTDRPKIRFDYTIESWLRQPQIRRTQNQMMIIREPSNHHQNPNGSEIKVYCFVNTRQQVTTHISVLKQHLDLFS